MPPPLIRARALATLALASLVLGACSERRRDSAKPPAPAAPVAHAPAAAATVAPTITVVPATTELLSQAAAGGALIRRILEVAQPAIGTPYKWAGTDLAKGIDCSNFTWLIYRAVGVPYPRYIRTQNLATMQRNEGFSQVAFADAEPGDLLVYGHRDDDGWHGHVVVLVDRSGRLTGRPGLVLGAHGTPVSAVQLVVAAGFAQGWFKTPEMRLVNVLRPVGVTGAQ